MANRSVVLVVDAKVDGLINKLKTGQKAIEDMAQGAKKFGPTASAGMAKAKTEFLATGRAAHKAAADHGLLYDASGKLVDQFGRTVSSADAAKKGLKEVSDEARFASEEADRMAQSLQTAGDGLMLFGAAAVAGVGLAVTKFASFDKAMSGVQAATHESAENMGILRQAAIDAGADTAFSAEEAAQGIEELAKAGVSTADVVGGGLTGALDLAAAGELAVGDAAEIAASAMTQFKLSGDQIPHLADLLAAGAGKAQGGVSDLGAALNQAGLVASSTGLTIEETTGGLAAFASAGLVGSDAGTSFKSMLQRLTPQSKQAQEQFDELGISAYDAQGNFVGLSNFAGQLQTKMADLTPEARNAAMSVMFGSDAVRASNVLYEQGAAGIQDWIDQVNDAGYASETAALLQNNLAGDIEKLGGAIDTVFIQAGGTANEALRGLVQGAEAVIDVVGKIPAPILGFGTVLAGIAGGAALLAGAAINVIPKISATKDALKDLGVIGKSSGKQVAGAGMSFVTIDAAMGKSERSARRLGSALKTVGSGAMLLAGVGPAIASMVPSGSLANIDELTAGLLDVSEFPAILDKAFTGKGNWYDGLDVGGFEDAIGVIANPSWSEKVDSNISKFLTFGMRNSSNWEFAKKNVDQLDSALSDMVRNGNTDSAAEAYEVLARKARSAGVPVEELAALFPQYSGALQRVDAESKNAAGGTDELGGAMGELGAEVEQVELSLDDIIANLFELGVLTRDVRAAESDFEASIDGVTDSIKENGKSLDVTTEKGRANRAALDGLASSGQAYTESLAQSGASEKELQSSMQGTYDSLITAAGQFGITGDKAIKLARHVMGVPDGVDIDTWMSDSAAAMALVTAQNIEAIPGYTTVSVAVSEDGTVGQVQSKINGVTGKTEYVFVTDDGTVTNVQQGIANIDGKDVPVWVTDDGTVVGTQGEINGIKGKNVTVTVGASTSGAEQAIDHVSRPRTSTLTVYERFVPGARSPDNGPKTSQFGRSPGGYTGGLVGRLINGLAGGGMVPGQIPLNSQGDNILATVNGKPFGLRSGEMVVNEKATRENLDLLQAINGGATIKLPGLANGGRVGAAEKRVKSAQKAYSAIDSKKANKARKQAAKDQLDAAKEELKAAKASAKLSAEAAKEARERAGRLSDSRFDLSRDLRRGEITDSFKSGSGMSVVDRMFTDSKSEDLSKGKRAGLRRDAFQLEGQLIGLGKQSDSLKTKLEKATEARDRLLEVSKSVSGGLRGEYSLGGVLSNLLSGDQKGPLAASSFVKSAQGKAAQFKRFGVMLGKLRNKGYNEAIIQEIADLGTVEGTQVGNALLGATGTERKQINAAYDSMDYWSGQAGKEVTKSMQQGGIDAAEGLVAGLEGKTKDVEDAFYNLGKSAEKAFRKSLDMHSPSRTLAVSGRDALDGILVGHDDRRKAVIDAYASLGNDVAAAYQPNLALAVPPSHEVSQHARAQAAPIDYERLTNMVIAAARATPVEASIHLDGVKLGKGITDIQNSATRGRPAAPFLAQK